MNITITKTTHPGTLPPSDQLGFGTVFTDHMFLMDYSADKGWHDARVVPYGPITMSPAASVLHYGTEVFEGMKAYRRPDGGVQLFRPWENVARLNRSCERLGLPQLDPDDALQAIKTVVKVDENWVPSDPGTSLYIRPFLYGTDPTLALHGVHEATFAIILSPSGSYFKNGLQPVPIMVETEDVRHGDGGGGVQHVVTAGVGLDDDLDLSARGGLHREVALDGVVRRLGDADVVELSVALEAIRGDLAAAGGGDPTHALGLTTGDDPAVFAHGTHELAEGVLEVLDGAVVVEVVRLDVGDHDDGRVEEEERAVGLVGSNSINLPIQTPNNIFGNNWDDYSIETIVDNSGNLNIRIEGKTTKSHAWFSFNNFRLVRLGDLDAVTLDEAADNVIEAKEAANVTLKRKFVANKWNTLVLPFAVSDADVKTTFGADAKIVEYSNAEDVNINFTTSTKGIKANVPVLIMPAAVNVENTYTFNSVSIVVADPKADGTSYSFVGSYKPYNLVNDDYMLYADKWWKTEAADSYKIKAFRAYIKAKTPAAAKQLNLVIDGQTTGLKLNTVNGNIEGETYNIAGQRVANSYKGLIIKNGKKIIKK